MATLLLVRGRPATLTGVAVVARIAFVLIVVCVSELVLGTVVLTTAFFYSYYVHDGRHLQD